MNIYAEFSQTTTHLSQPLLTGLPFAVMFWDGAVKQHKVTPDEVGRLDIIAWKEYGDVTLGWFIKEYNGLIDPLSEITDGMFLEIPQNVSASNIQAWQYNANI